MKNIKLQIALLPDLTTIQTVVKLNALARKFSSTTYVIDNIKFFPHLTLYTAVFPVVRLDEIVANVGNIANTYSELNLTMNKVSAENEYILVDYQENSDIRKIHEAVVRKLNIFRDGILREKYLDRDYMNTLPPEQQRLAKEYGYHYIFDYYHPHLTIVRYDIQSSALKVLPYIQSAEITNKLKHIKLQKLIIAESGEHSTCNKILYEYPL